MDKFVRNLLTEWRKLGLPFSGETFVVAVSGGADSLSLALTLHELKKRKKLENRYVVAHFNHGLRGKYSDDDEQFIKNLAAEFGFELAVKRGEIGNLKGNLEQNARNARYRFLNETAGRINAVGILTAHTLNDQAETFLMNLVRGSGLKGLGGMRQIRESQIIDQNQTDIKRSSYRRAGNYAVPVIRPLLTWATREMTEKYCIERGTEFRYDSMNDDLAFQRVRIRKVLMPLLKDFNPKIIEGIAATSFLLQEEFDALEEMFNANSTESSGSLSSRIKEELEIKELKKMPFPIRRKIVREWLKRNRGNLRSLDIKHADAIENLIFSRKSGKTVELPGASFVFKENGKLLYIEKKS